MACTGKHTAYQPKMPDEWKCPKCGTGLDYRDARGLLADGWIINDSASEADSDCDLNHPDDEIGCGKCGYGCSGATFARKLQKKHNLITCPHCLGVGLVKGGA